VLFGVENMLIINSKPFYHIVINIDNYKEHKEALLNLINNARSNAIYKTVKTDFELDDANYQYKELFLSMIKQHMIKLKQELSFSEYKAKLQITRLWFQQYNKSNYHKWHSHADCNYSNVFYLENDADIRTEFYDYVSKKTYDIEVKEGDLLVFPSYLIHKSKPNNSDKRKTVIAFNINIKDETD